MNLRYTVIWSDPGFIVIDRVELLSSRIPGFSNDVNYYLVGYGLYNMVDYTVIWSGPGFIVIDIINCYLVGLQASQQL